VWKDNVLVERKPRNMAASRALQKIRTLTHSKIERVYQADDSIRQTAVFGSCY
jgi:hypothetical protein